jgi:hypothetical protein
MISDVHRLEALLKKCTPEMAALASRVLAKLRQRLPGAVEFVYDKPRSLVVGFGPTEKPSDAILSIEVYREWLNLYFLDGAVMPDPDGMLQGAGKRVRHIKVRDAAVLDDPRVQSLIDDAVELSGASFGQRKR